MGVSTGDITHEEAKKVVDDLVKLIEVPTNI
jgi:polyhydroxyalkanoate synthesis regulator phasin